MNGSRQAKNKKSKECIAPINQRPLLPSGPDGVSRDLAVHPCRGKATHCEPRCQI